LTAAVPATAEAADNRIDQRRRLRVLPAVMVVQLTGVMAGVVVATAGPAVAADLHGLRLYPWLFSSYALMTAISGPVAGKLSDVVGRPFYILGMVLLVTGAFAAPLAPNIAVLLVARAVAGAGGAPWRL
jgi:MFS family permease